MQKILLSQIERNLYLDKISSLSTVKKYHKKKGRYYGLTPDTVYGEKVRNLASLLKQIPLNSACVAYRDNYCYFDFFKPHLKGEYFLRLDIKNFFHSIEEKDIRKVFSNHVRNDLSYQDAQVTTLLTQFVTLKEDGNRFLPIGFPASPTLANIIFRPLDIQIQKICRQAGIRYTRYADDLLFSAEKSNLISSNHFKEKISFIVAQKGLRLNSAKTLVKTREISLNGYRICGESKNKYIQLSNKKLKPIKKVVREKIKGKLSDKEILKKLDPNIGNALKLRNEGKAEFLKRFFSDQLMMKFRGYRSYLISLLRYEENNPKSVHVEHLETLRRMVDDINHIIDKWH